MRVAIIGAGFGGIAAAIALQNDHDVVVIDRAPDVGGTWLFNDYPGAACDVPSHLYSFSFEQRRDWPRLCSPRDEIYAYIREVAAQYGIEPVLNTEIATADHADGWTLTATDGRTFGADALVVATGQLHRTHTPRLPGTFAGHSFHSAEWDHDYDLTGKRVAVIGTGASAVQFVPEIARQVERLYVFQRTGNWFLPRRNRPYPRALKALLRRVPALQAARRAYVFRYCEALTAAIRHPRTVGRIVHARSAAFMRWQLRDHPELRRKVWPDYPFGCKRVLFSSYFLPALARENAELITDPIEPLTEHAINGREVDCLIYATGFKATDFMLPLRISARGHTLQEVWKDGPFAHLGITVPGFPGLFLMYGPNTNTSGGSILVYHEAQANYIAQALRHGVVEVRPEVAARSDAELQARFDGTAWTACDSWYRDRSGRIVTNWPGYMREYQERTRRFEPAEFVSTS
jgi:cation diffusion facilitator CzcD-associated flavoprotein CzcO